MALGQLNIHMEKMNLDLYYTTKCNKEDARHKYKS